MIWGLITKSRLNLVLFVWALVVSFACMAVLSSIPMLALRYFYLPQDEVSIPLDFVPKTIKTPQGERNAQLIALHDLRKVRLANVHYSVDLSLKLPRNPINLNLGNFGIRGALGDYDWSSHRTSLIDNANALDVAATGPNIVEKMALIPYKSAFVEALSTFLWSPLYVLGMCSEESHLTINLWADTDRPKLNYPHVLIMLPRDIWVSEASLNLAVRLTGLRWLLKTFPISTFLMSSAVFMLCEIVGAASILMIVSARILLAPPERSKPRGDSEPIHKNAQVPSSAEEKKGTMDHSAPISQLEQLPVSENRPESISRNTNEETLDIAHQLDEAKDADPLQKHDEENETERSVDDESTLVKESGSSALLTEAEVGLLSPEY